jgi:hypothetical protein
MWGLRVKRGCPRRRGESIMTTTITVKVIYETDQEADAFVDAIETLDYDGMFPTGASVQREVK